MEFKFKPVARQWPVCALGGTPKVNIGSFHVLPSTTTTGAQGNRVQVEMRLFFDFTGQHDGLEQSQTSDPHRGDPWLLEHLTYQQLHLLMDIVTGKTEKLQEESSKYGQLNSSSFGNFLQLVNHQNRRYPNARFIEASEEQLEELRKQYSPPLT